MRQVSLRKAGEIFVFHYESRESVLEVILGGVSSQLYDHFDAAVLAYYVARGLEADVRQSGSSAGYVRPFELIGTVYRIAHRETREKLIALRHRISRQIGKLGFEIDDLINSGYDPCRTAELATLDDKHSLLVMDFFPTWQRLGTLLHAHKY